MTEPTWRIVTPEAVVLDLEAAGMASRILAALLDLVVLGIVLSSVSTASSAVAGNLSPTLGVVVALIGTFLLLVAWPVAWETATKGRSVGKMALGLRVVTVEGAPIRFRHAVIRGFVGLFELLAFFGVPALTIALFSSRFRRLGDHLAGTVVVRERTGLPPSVAMVFNPPLGWEGFVAALDSTRLEPAHQRLVRSYLLQVRHLSPAARQELGRRTVDLVAERMHLPPDQRAVLAGHDPVTVLTAVAASYQRRFWR